MSDEAKELAIKKLAEAIATFTIQGHVSSQTLAVDLYEASYRRIDISKLKPLTDGEITQLVRKYIKADKHTNTIDIALKVSQATVDKIKAEIERQKDGG